MTDRQRLLPPDELEPLSLADVLAVVVFQTVTAIAAAIVFSFAAFKSTLVDGGTAWLFLLVPITVAITFNLWRLTHPERLSKNGLFVDQHHLVIVDEDTTTQVHLNDVTVAIGKQQGGGAESRGHRVFIVHEERQTVVPECVGLSPHAFPELVKQINSKLESERAQLGLPPAPPFET